MARASTATAANNQTTPSGFISLSSWRASSTRPLVSQGRRSASGVFQAGFRFGGLFNLHVAKLFGVKDFATIQALDEFGVFVPGNDAYPRVLAGGCHRSWVWWKKLLFPPNCIGIFPHLKTISDESFFHLGFSSGGKDKFRQGLQSRQKWSYTKYGPKKSDIQCSN
jgi:hypothetical protein